MALFESYERRIKQINEVLNSYGISSIEEAEKITKDAGLDVYNQVKSIQPICFENACWAYTVGAQSRRTAERLQKLQQQSVKAFSHSVSQVQLLIHVRLVLDMVTLVRCYWKKRQSASVS